MQIPKRDSNIPPQRCLWPFLDLSRLVVAFSRNNLLRACDDGMLQLARNPVGQASIITLFFVIVIITRWHGLCENLFPKSSHKCPKSLPYLVGTLPQTVETSVLKVLAACWNSPCLSGIFRRKVLSQRSGGPIHEGVGLSETLRGLCWIMSVLNWSLWSLLECNCSAIAAMKIIKHHQTSDQTTDESLTQSLSSLSIFDWLWESSPRRDGFEHFSVNPLTLHSWLSLGRRRRCVKGWRFLLSFY